MELEGVFRTSPLFQSFSREEIAAILGAGRETIVPEGGTLFRMGDEAHTMFLVASGEVRLVFPTPRESKVLSRGEQFGELALIRPGHRRSATAIASSESRVVELSRDVFERLVEIHPRVLLRLLEVVTDYLLGSERELNEELTRRNRALGETLDYLQRTREELDQQELLARTDELTRLYNRRCFNDQLGRFLRRARAEGIGLALVMVDLDDFKAINDRHGHPTGDSALVHVSEILRKTVRRSDLPCRIGGDEFAVLLLDIELEGARARARQIRERIALSHFPSIPDGRPVSVTASLGGTLLAAGEDPDSFRVRADHALYAAKGGGRNRLVWANFEGAAVSVFHD